MDNTLINRINELAEKSYSENRFVFTDFLDMAQLSTYYSLERDLSYVGTSVSGGTDGCERCMVRFGSPDSLGYDEAFPIVLLHISPVQKKFSDALTHRDFLGSVIGLGIERTKLGDIIVRDNEGYIFVNESISEYITENLSKVKHTNVRVEKCLDIPEAVAPKFSEESIIVSSNRLDAVIAKVYNLSRDLAVRCISEGRVYINGRLMTGNAKSLKTGDIVSVRGKGKFIFDGEGGTTRKDKLYISIKRYI
jgi:RNA-binding protein YlmH